MSKATVNLMKRYISILNITNGNRYLGSEDVMQILKSDYGIDVARRVVQRDLNDLYSVGAIERKGNAPISWRSGGVDGMTYIVNILDNYEIRDSGIIEFGIEDIVRSGITRDFVIAYEEDGWK